MDQIELSRMVENIIRFGTIHSVDHPARLCRVQSGKLTTQWLKWFELRAGETKTWNPPTFGEQCIVLSPSGEVGAGVVLYGIPSDANQTPSEDANKHVIKFPDGAVISYDHSYSHLDLTGIVTCHIEASESITHDTPITHVTGELIVDGLLTYKDGIDGTGGGNNNRISGNFTHADGDLSSNGVVLHHHAHENVKRGDEISGFPI